MFGSAQHKYLYGDWHHIGTMASTELALPADGTPLPKGTWIQAKNGDEFMMALASGHAAGFLTQDISAEGHESLQAFKDRTIGKFDLPVKKGQMVSLRVPHSESLMEFEGVGAAVPGNLVCTTGTGAIASNAAVNAELSFFNGCIRLAQAGDIVTLLLKQADLTPEVTGRRRIRVEKVSGYVK